MSREESTTFWIDRLRGGDSRAIEELWRSYYDRVVNLARRKLAQSPRRVADEEDVALSAFHSFWAGVEEARFPQLKDRQDLWRLLVVITCRKAGRLKQGQLRQKRGGGRVRGESAFFSPGGEDGDFGIDNIGAVQPGPASTAELAEQFHRLLDLLGDDSLRELALLKLQGFTHDEIAERLQCGLRTVERRLRLIRVFWSKEAGS
jgi:DNA-directed RNA polymerase specialized sigma24 family protein